MKSLKYSLSLVSCLLVFWITSAASLYFEPSNGSLYQNCKSSVQVVLDTQKDQILWASVKIHYNPSEIEVDGFYPNKEFNLPLPVKQDENSFVVSLLSLIRNDQFDRVGFSGKVVLWTLVFSPRSNVNHTIISFTSTAPRVREDDNDIFLLSNAADIFDRSINGEYFFFPWTCSPVQVSGPDYIHDAAKIQDTLNQNLALIDKQTKVLKEGSLFTDFRFYLLIILILILLAILVYSLRNKGASIRKPSFKKK